MSKPISKGLVIVLTLVAGVFMAPSLMFFGSVQATETITDISETMLMLIRRCLTLHLL